MICTGHGICVRRIAETLVLAALSVPASWAGVAECEGAAVTVIYRDEADARTACHGAAEALAFLRQQGLDTRVPLEIDVVEKCGERHDWPVLAQADTRVMRIEMLSYAACERAGRARPTFGVAMTRALQRSLVAHEVAHAIAQFNFHVSEPPRAAHEYIAYATQFATMDPALRADILERHDSGAWETLEQINETVYYIGPDEFAVKTHRHFAASPDQREVLRRLLRGNIGRWSQ